MPLDWEIKLFEKPSPEGWIPARAEHVIAIMANPRRTSKCPSEKIAREGTVSSVIGKFVTVDVLSTGKKMVFELHELRPCKRVSATSVPAAKPVGI